MSTEQEAVSNNPRPPNPVIAIIGGRAQNVSDQHALRLAERVGRELARAGYGVATGGCDGIGAAACRGAWQVGGTTIAVLKEKDLRNCSPYITWAIPTSYSLGRSVALNWIGDAIVAFDGGYGTMFELALALDTNRPIVITGRQERLERNQISSDSCRWVLGNSPDLYLDVMLALRDLIGPSPVDNSAH